MGSAVIVKPIVRSMLLLVLCVLVKASTAGSHPSSKRVPIQASWQGYGESEDLDEYCVIISIWFIALCSSTAVLVTVAALGGVHKCCSAATALLHKLHAQRMCIFSVR